MRLLAAILLASLTAPAFAAGDGFEGAPWWGPVAFNGLPLAILSVLAVGSGFFLQGFLRLRNAVISLIIVSVAFLAWLATVYGFEKIVGGLPLFASLLALFSPLFGLGWCIGVKDATRRSDRKIAPNAGNNHG
jgi:hypothetical protein